VAGSEELERSLRREIERQIDALAGEQRDAVLRAQRELNDALARFTERLSGNSLGDPLASAINEHLRSARNVGADEAARSTGASANGDVALLKAAVDEIDAQRTQSDILNALVNRAASFAPRIAFFVVKNERATGWRARGLEGTVGDDRVRDISLGLSSDTILSEVYRTRAAWSGAPGSKADDHQLLSKLGGEPPARMIAVPLVARDKCVAVLYADSAGLEADAVNLEALETLVRVTGMAVELLAVKRGAPAQTSTTAAQTSHPASMSPAESSDETTQPTAQAQANEASQMSEATPHVEASAPGGATQQVADAATTNEAAPARGAAPISSSSSEVSSPISASSSSADSSATSSAGSSASSSEAAVPHAAPLGASRRYGQDAELPVEVSDEERRYHNDARRFARLLVSEIKLYNEQKVTDGRANSDLYTRLREEIDRSRQMYDKRVHPSVAPRYDYFHQEIVSTLAGGDAARLGAGYPGATIAA
jgi:hypothetical protein